jgi:hypothetical protein
LIQVHAPHAIYLTASSAARVLYAPNVPRILKSITDPACQKITARLDIAKIVSSMFLINARHVR